MSGGAAGGAAEEVGRVDALTHEAEGVVHAGKTVFVAGALPGERVRFRRVRRRKRHDEAELLEVLEPAAGRTVPRCAHFGVCGGCALQHLAPPLQLEAKQAELRDSLERLGRVQPAAWLEPIAGPVWAYRRRARLGARFVPKKGRALVGFRERLAPYIAALEGCEVLAEPVGRLISPLSALITELSVREHLPQIELVVADNATALVLRLLRQPSAADLERLTAFELRHDVRLYAQSGGPGSITRLRQVADETPLRYRLAAFEIELELGPTDFIQVNGAVNAALVERAVSLLQVGPDSQVLDLYCGLGNLTLPLARRAGQVVGVEGEASLVERARHNARLNQLPNVGFVTADLSQPLDPGLPWLQNPFSHVLLDPPRVGARDVMRTIARIHPRRVLYISCHPGSLARDVGILVHEHGFVLEAAGIVDMFPHTTHVESLALLAPGAL